jgi:Zn-ribbon-containing, possibly RNA-binding protein and truncated derivatives
MTDERPRSSEGAEPVPRKTSDDDSEQGNQTRRTSIDVARGALAAAKAEAKRRGLATRAGGAGGRTDEAPGENPRRRRKADTSARSGAHPDDRDPQLLDASLDRLVADRGWETDAAVGGAMGRWPAIVGPQIAEHSTPVSFADGELVVAAATTAWATQLRMLAPTLVRRLAAELGEGTVEKVTVLGPSAPSWKRGALRIKGRGPRDTYG